MEIYDLECQFCFRYFQSYDGREIICPECRKKIKLKDSYRFYRRNEEDRDDLPYDLFAIDDDIELNIAPVVKELRDAGFDTFTSCDGGEGHAFKMPTIRISHKNWFIKNENDFCCVYHPKELLNISEFSPNPMDILQKVYDFVVEKDYFADVILDLNLGVRDDGKVCIEPMIQITFPFGIVRRMKNENETK